MLVLTRRAGESLVLGDGVTLVVTSVHGGAVRIGIDAPAAVRVRREERPSVPSTDPVVMGPSSAESFGAVP